MDSFIFKFHACISPKTAKYLQNLRFSRKLHHDSPIEGTKTSNLYRPIELDELYRMVMTSSGWNHWIRSERANPRRSAEFFFREGGVFFWKTWKFYWQGHFLRNIILQRKLVKNVFCIYFSVYVAFLLSVGEQGASAIIQFIILSHCWVGYMLRGREKIVIGQYGRIEKNGRKMKWGLCLSHLACSNCIGHNAWWEERKKFDWCVCCVQ